MARRITEKAKVSAQRTIDPWSQPCFASYTWEHSSYGGGWMLYDHKLNCIATLKGDGNQAYSSFRSYTSGASEFCDNYASAEYQETTSHASTHSRRAGMINQVGYLGHQNFTPAATRWGNTGGWMCGNSAQNYRGHMFRDVIPLPNEKYQDYAVMLQHNGGTGTLIHCMPRSANLYYHYALHDHSWRCNIPIQENNYQGMYGAGSYNRSKKQLLVMETSANFTFKPVVWSNVPDLREISERGASGVYKDMPEQYAARGQYDNRLQTYFNDSSNADSTTYAVSTTASNNYSGQNESNYRGVATLCDDGQIYFFQMTPNDGAILHHWNADGTYAGVIMHQEHNNTSYGYEQGVSYGARWNQTSDGRYIWKYCASYYYGSGGHFVAVRVKDGKYLTWWTSDSNYARQTCPIGKSSVCVFADYNADGGAGLYNNVIDFEKRFATLENGSTSLNMETSWLTQLVDTPSNTTSYTGMVPLMYDTSLFTSETELLSTYWRSQD